MLDGVSALQAAGLTGIEANTVRVSVPRGARVPKVAGVTVRQTRRLSRGDLAGPGLPRVRPDLGLRVAPSQFLAQVRQALIDGGWQPTA